MRIQSHVPFDTAIKWWLDLSPMVSFETLTKQSRRYEYKYLMWESVRRTRNPFFVNGTGFEGYFVGDCDSPHAALEALLHLGEQMLIGIMRFHRYDYQFRSRLIKTLVDERPDPEAIHEWSAELGACLARLRAQALYDPRIEAFHNATEIAVTALPSITYLEQDHQIRQNYRVNSEYTPPRPRLRVTPGMLKPWQQEVWLVMRKVGMFGHPLVRQYLCDALH